jgi:hypothetical protein
MGEVTGRQAAAAAEKRRRDYLPEEKTRSWVSVGR